MALGASYERGMRREDVGENAAAVPRKASIQRFSGSCRFAAQRNSIGSGRPDAGINLQIILN
jgi:hypothetical protein